MNILLFFYFVMKDGGEKNGKKVEYATDAVNITFAIVWFPILLIVYTRLDSIGLMSFLSENWPYDYGRMHARNYFSPIGVFVMLFTWPSYVCFKKLINRDKVQAKILDLFENEKCRALSKKLTFLPILMAFISSLGSLSISLGAYILIPIITVLYIVMELMVRKSFPGNNQNN